MDMGNVYFGCAAVGGTVLVLQTLLALFGIGHHDVDGAPHEIGEHGLGHDEASAHHDGESFLRLFTFKSIIAFLTFFGLAGLACERRGTQPGTAFLLAIAAGATSLWVVAWMMQSLARLQSRGNVKIENAVGLTGKVYLRVPARNEGAGKVTVAVQGRTVELRAVTGGGEIPTGAAVTIVATRPPDTLEVVPFARAAHSER